jgi:hypothetical protein
MFISKLLPLLQQYRCPSGPTASPFGPPPGLATVCLEPSGLMRVISPDQISTTMTEPSSIATGPSGNFRSLAISLMCMDVTPTLLFFYAEG